MKIFKTYIAGCFAICMATASCQKLLELEPPKNQLSDEGVFTDTSSAKSALLNIYVELERVQNPASNKFLSVYADESVVASTTLAAWNQSRVSPTETSVRANWVNLYSAIYQANMVIEKLAKGGLPDPFSARLGGEARFLRAYCYFYLQNIYGNVPLITSTDVTQTRLSFQADSAAVYELIKADLVKAREILPLGAKIRANRDAATALLSRVNFYQRNWAMAEELSTELINSDRYTPLEPPSNVFKAASKESILQFATPSGFIADAASAIPASATALPSYYFTSPFYASFENADLRRSSWIGTSINLGVSYRYCWKYKNRALNTTNLENHIVLRIAEQYLIRAEARTWLGKFSGTVGAEGDINVIRQRAGLPVVSVSNFFDAINAVYNERKHELFFENADRFMDLKRTGRVQQVMSLAKPTWLPTAKLLPIPESDLVNNPNLKQNEGY